jgi:hypothetical protein
MGKKEVLTEIDIDHNNRAASPYDRIDFELNLLK